MSTNRKLTAEELYPLPAGIKTRTCKFGASPVSAPVPGTAAGFRYEFEDLEQGLRVVVAEGADGRLTADAMCRDGALRGRAGVSVGIAGTRSEDAIRKTIPLSEPAAGGGCRGSADFGPRADAIARLGEQFVFVVFLLVEKSEQRHPVPEPVDVVPKKAGPSQPGRRTIMKGLAALAAALLVAGGAALIYFTSRPNPQPGPWGQEFASRDEFNANPDDFLIDKHQQKNVMSGSTSVLHNGETRAFKGRHPAPLKHQWLLHIDGGVRLVASAGGDEDLTYTLQQVSPEWWGRDRRFEFLVIVTANDVPPGWPEKVDEKHPPSIEGLLTLAERKELQAVAWNPDPVRRNESARHILRNAFDRYLGKNKCWFQVNAYKSENT